MCFLKILNDESFIYAFIYINSLNCSVLWFCFFSVWRVFNKYVLQSSFILLSFLKDSVTGYRVPGWQIFFSFQLQIHYSTDTVSFYSIVSDEKSALIMLFSTMCWVFLLQFFKDCLWLCHLAVYDVSRYGSFLLFPPVLIELLGSLE